MKTTLCLNCAYGLVREAEDEVDEKNTYYTNRCLLGMDYPGTMVTMCNRHRKKNVKVTYHDPEFDKYVDKMLNESK